MKLGEYVNGILVEGHFSKLKSQVTVVMTIGSLVNVYFTHISILRISKQYYYIHMRNSRKFVRSLKSFIKRHKINNSYSKSNYSRYS